MRPVGELLLLHLSCQSHLVCHKQPGLPRAPPKIAKVKSPNMAIPSPLPLFATYPEALADSISGTLRAEVSIPGKPPKSRNQSADSAAPGKASNHTLVGTHSRFTGQDR